MELMFLHKIQTKINTSLQTIFALLLIAMVASPIQAQETADSLSNPDSTMFNDLKQRSSGWFVDLPDGGQIWASEDPSLTNPVLNISAASVVGFNGDNLTDSLRFSGYSNYPSFIKQAEILVYRGRDQTLSNPLVTIPVKPSLSMRVKWDGQLPEGHGLQQGGNLKYIMRVYGPGGEIDETYPREISLLSPQKMEMRRTRGQSATANTEQQVTDGQSDVVSSNNMNISRAVYGKSNLRIQNIPIVGSSIRIQGQDISEEIGQVYINGRSVPVDQNNRFMAEYLLPAGHHSFKVRLDTGTEDIVRTLNVKASANHFFMVGIADFTASKNGLYGNVEPLDGNENFDEELLVEGRAAFYLKAKIKGQYLITAQADTREEEIDDMFNGFFGKAPQDLFRRLDPDKYYPVYGDDATTHRDVNTQGKFYVRVNWDKSEFVWGNYSTQFTDNELTRYQRGLYGGALRYQSPATTQWGQSKLQLAAFGSDAQTVNSHNEFISTGASVYYLKNTDLLPGSEEITVELRDVETGLTEQTITLRPDVDYEIDHLQGRIILKQPISQIVQEKDIGVIRNVPQDNLRNILLVDYEYVPSGLQIDNITAGAQGKFWLGDHVGVGGTYVNEGRGSTDEYGLAGADLTLQADRSTYLKVEAAKSEQSQAPVYLSNDGGLTFDQTIKQGAAVSRSGDAYSVKGHASLATVFGSSETDYFNQNPWNIKTWWKDRGSGFSVARRERGYNVKEYGAEIDAKINDHFQMLTEVSKQKLDPSTSAAITSSISGTSGKNLTKGQLVGEYKFNEHHQVTTEIQSVRESTFGSKQGEALLAGTGYEVNFNNGLQLYGLGQTEVVSNSSYQKNDRITGGAQYLWRDNTTLGGEYSYGSRGDAFSVNANHNLTQNYEVYGRYGWSPDYNSNALFGPSQIDGITIGQRWRATQKLSVFHESQKIQTGSETGTGHSLGLDYTPAEFWSLGLRMQGANLQAQPGEVKRRAATLTAGMRNSSTEFSSKFEYRGDFGAERRTQLVTTQRIRHKITESWRVAGRFNFADTDDKNTSFRDARFIESNIGFSFRPWNMTRWGILSKFTYLYDRQSAGQFSGSPLKTTGSSFDQQSLVTSMEGIYQLSKRFELSAKGALRIGQIKKRAGAPDDSWFKSTTQFLALQLRYQVWRKWDVLGEGRWRRNLEAQDSRQGFLVSVNRRITDFLQIGAGYNFTDFSDDPTDLDYNDRGWFINIVGIY